MQNMVLSKDSSVNNDWTHHKSWFKQTDFWNLHKGDVYCFVSYKEGTSSKCTNFQLGSLASEPLTIKHSHGDEEGITESIIEQIAHCLFIRSVHNLFWPISTFCSHHGREACFHNKWFIIIVLHVNAICFQYCNTGIKT